MSREPEATDKPEKAGSAGSAGSESPTSENPLSEVRVSAESAIGAARGRLRQADELDRWLLKIVTTHPTPGLDRWMPRISRASDHLVLWWVLAGAMAASGRPRLRAAARSGLTAMLVAGPACNLVGKQVVNRSRPPRRVQRRRPGRVPDSGSLPSGHTAAAMAFATGVSARSPAAGLPVAGLAVAIAYSRVYTGAHFPGDVAVGAVAGTGTALMLRRRAGRRTGPVHGR